MAEEKKVIVVAVDKSECSDKALEYYLAYLHRSCHKVIFLHAAEVPKIATPFHGVNIEEAENTHSMWIEAAEKRETELKALHKHVEELVSNCGHVVDHEILITQYHHGHLGEAIVDLVENKQATMVVVGTRGLGTLRRTILGSVSDYVLHHSKCPVIICHFETEKFHLRHEGRRSFSN